MIRTSASFINIQNLEVEITIKAPYREWMELLDLIDDNKYPGSKFHEYAREALRRLERQVDIAGAEKL